MPRSTKEWIGKTADHAAPPKVRQRVFDRAGGVCHWCKLPIKVPVETWQADHVVALINGGANAEGNLAPIHSHCHVAKTGRDVTEKSKVAKARQQHLGIKRPKQKIRSAGFPASGRIKVERKALPPRQLYGERNEG